MDYSRLICATVSKRSLLPNPACAIIALPCPTSLLSTQARTLPNDRWDAFVAGHPDGHVLQSSRWAALKCRFGWQAERGVHGRWPDRGRRAGAAATAPWAQTLAYVPKGPLVDWRKPPQVRELMEGLRQVALAHKAALLKLEPDLPDSPLLDLQLQSYGLRRGHPVQPRSTIHLDLSGGPEAVLAGMKQKWRYNVRLAERKGVRRAADGRRRFSGLPGHERRDRPT